MRPWLGPLLLLGSWLVLQPAMLGSDERGAFRFAAALCDARFDWHRFIAEFGDAATLSIANHDFAWILPMVAAYWPLWLAGRVVPFLASPAVVDFYMAAFLNLPIWLAAWTGWRVLRRRGHTPALAGLALAGIFAGGYGISAFPGSGLVNLEALLVTAQLLMIARGRTGGNALLLGLLGGYMTALRPYQLPVALGLAFLMCRSDRRLAWHWLAGAAASFAVAFLLKIALALPPRDYQLSALMAEGLQAFLPVYLDRAAQALFSFSYSIPFTMPFLLFAFACPDKRAAAVKTAAIALVLAGTLLYPFWAGNAGMAGNRYLFADLLLLLPEAADGFARLVRRDRRVALAAPLLVLLFLPCLTFRHNVTVGYAVGEDTALHHPVIGRPLVVTGAVERDMPVWNPLFQPAVFAWWQAAALAGHRTMVLPLGAPVAVSPALIPPYGLVFRMLYLEKAGPSDIVDPRIAAALAHFRRVPVAARAAVYVLAAALALVWLALLLLATRAALARPERTDP